MTAVKAIVFNNTVPVKKLINSFFISSSSFPRHMSSCIFCKIVSGDAPAEIYFQDDEVVVFKDIKPCSKFHFLAVPKQHIDNVNRLTPDHVQLIETLIAKGKYILSEKGGDVEDIRLGFHLPPFNSVGHLHLHVISPAAEMSFIQRLVFKPNSWWFSSVDQVLEKLGASKL